MTLLFSLSGMLLASLALGADSAAAHTSRAQTSDARVEAPLDSAGRAPAAEPPLAPLSERTDGFMILAGLNGPTPNRFHKDAFDLTAFGLSRSDTTGSLKRWTLGVSIPATEASAALYLQSAQGRPIQTVEFELVPRAAQPGRSLLTITLTNAVARAVDAGNFSAAFGSVSPLSLVFSFDTIEFDALESSAKESSMFWANTAHAGSKGFSDGIARSLSAFGLAPALRLQ